MKDDSGDWRRAVLAGAAELGLAIGEAELSAYQAHLDLLLEHNERAGLTAITGETSASASSRRKPAMMT